MSRSAIKVKKSRARNLRRGFPIHAYIGANGGGKSLAAVYDTLPSLAAGRSVVSTLRLIDPATGADHPLWVPLGLDPDVPAAGQVNPYRVLLEAEFCDLILDEVTGIASSRDSMSMPTAIANHLVQLRRRDVALRWTAPNWKRADTIIRECSQAATLCLGFWKQTMAAEDGSDRQWSSRRLFYWRTYDAVAFDEWSTYRKERHRPVARQLIRREASPAPKVYDTYAPVRSLAEVTEGGKCLDCGGYRAKPKCACGTTRTRAVVFPETDETPAVGVVLPHTGPLVGLTTP